MSDQMAQKLMFAIRARDRWLAELEDRNPKDAPAFFSAATRTLDECQSLLEQTGEKSGHIDTGAWSVDSANLSATRRISITIQPGSAVHRLFLIYSEGVGQVVGLSPEDVDYIDRCTLAERNEVPPSPDGVKVFDGENIEYLPEALWRMVHRLLTER